MQKTKEYPFPLKNHLLSKALYYYKQDLTDHGRRLIAAFHRFETLNSQEQQILFDKIRAQYARAEKTVVKKQSKMSLNTKALYDTLTKDFRPFPDKHINVENLADVTMQRHHLIISHPSVKAFLTKMEIQKTLYMASGYKHLARANYLFLEFLPLDERPPTLSERRLDYYRCVANSAPLEPARYVYQWTQKEVEDQLKELLEPDAK